MGELRVTALGVGDTFSEDHVTASLLLEAEGFRLAVDCPDRYRGVLKRIAARTSASSSPSGAPSAPLTLESIDDVFITLHGDHMNGVEGVAFFKRFAENKRLRLHTTGDVRSVLWEQRLRAPMERLWDGREFKELGFEDYFDFTESPWDRTFAIGPFEITLARTKHHVPTAAMRVRYGDRTFAYSSDTAFDPSLIAFLAEADVVVHETNFGPAHTAYADLLTLPAEVRARMRLIHYPDTFDVAASEIACLREGDVLVV